MKLEDLPAVEFIECDTEKVMENLIATFEEETGRSLSPADPERLFLNAQTVIIGQLRIKMNEGAKQNLLAYAGDGFLEHLGVLVDSERIGEASAKTTMLFSLEQPHAEIVVIPQETRVTPDGQLFFTTDITKNIEIGEVAVEIDVTCITPGTIGNGYVPGQIKKLVDIIPYVKTVSNMTTTSGGASTESNDSFRENINNAPSSFSTAGPEAGYESLAKSAHQDIIDVKVTTPSDAEIEICVLMKGGELPSQEILDLVFEKCSPKDVRPLTDKITAVAPTQIEYNASVQYYISNTDLKNISVVQEKIEKAFNDYILWQKGKLGRDISPDDLIQILKIAGCKRLVEPPAFKVVASNEVAIEGIVSLAYAGAEDE